MLGQKEQPRDLAIRTLKMRSVANVHIFIYIWGLNEHFPI